MFEVAVVVLLIMIFSALMGRRVVIEETVIEEAETVIEPANDDGP